MTTASATSASASLLSDGHTQRQRSGADSSFAQEFELHSRDSHEAVPPRRASNTSKQPKENSGDAGPVATAIAPSSSEVRAIGLDVDPRGAREGPDSPGEGGGRQPVVAVSPVASPGPDLAAAGPQDTAFMMRMQLAIADDTSGSQAALADAGIQKIANDDTPAPLSLSSPGMMAPGLLDVLEGSGQREFDSEVKQVSAVAQTPDLQALSADEPVKAPQPLNNIQLQVSHSANEKVLVSLVQQSGELRLAVRTDDSDLAHGLQQGLPELVGKLQDNGFRADSWHPVHSPAPADPALESQQASSHSRQDSNSHSGGSQQDGGREQHKSPNKPRWVEELESSLTSKGQVIGDPYGFGS